MSKPITLLITGDYYGGGSTDSLVREGNYQELFGDILPVVKGSDFAITNLESPLTDSTRPIHKTGPAIRATPENALALKYAGFDLVTLANNHILDFGLDGLKETIAHLDNLGIGHCGVGLNYNEASAVFYKRIGDCRLAFINITENEWSVTNGSEPGANPLDPIKNFYVIKEAKQNSDYVFVLVHGGHENYNLPSPRMKKDYRFFIDSGADAVVGHHTHCFSGFEIYKGKHIFYSLGNFLFDAPGSINKQWNFGIAVKFTLHSEITMEVIPYSQNNGTPGTRLLANDERDRFFNYSATLNKIILDDIQLAAEFRKYCNTVRKLYGSYLEPYSSMILHALRNRELIPSFLGQRKRLMYQNLIRCEAHRDVILEIITPKNRLL